MGSPPEHLPDAEIAEYQNSYTVLEVFTVHIHRTIGLSILVMMFLQNSSVSQSNSRPTVGDMQAAGGTIHYEEVGQGLPVILMHGGQLDHRMWDDQVAVLSKIYRVIRYDIRGFGKSSDPQIPYADFDDLLALENYLHVQRAVLVGLSLGGRIALDFALLHPDRVSALVLVGPGLRGYRSPDDEIMNAKEWENVEAARDSGYVVATALWLRNPYMAPAMEQPRLREWIRLLALDNARNWLVNPLLERPLKPRAIDRLHDVKVPTLILVGGRDIRRMQGIADTLYHGIPGAEKEVIAGAGHIVNMEQPEQFNRSLLEFLEKRNLGK